ncbi:C39 family peptidase [Enterococcus xiangfangensis]|uniref:C39 family peptidase n=1 Tax=Enterococcus xiangfangensis TaxID=1296537 RepID=UPI003D1711D4|nr:glycosyhydrolase [Enterococcus asini]
MKKKVLLVGTMLVSSLVMSATIVLAEDTVSSSEAATAVGIEEAVNEQSSDYQTVENTEATANQENETSPSTEPQIAIINGEQVVLEPPVKAGKAEADATQAPKEELREGFASRARSARSASVQTIPMYRLYNPNSGEHFYTGNAAERDKVQKAGWRYEGIGWQAPLSGDPVYRMYNPNAGDHHYTMLASERDNLKRHGWRYEGISWYSDKNKSIKVYRAYNPNAKAGSHNYTIDYNEQKNIIKHGWRDEGIAWYATGGGQQNTDNYKLLGVKNYNQYALGAPSGCEGASLLQALQYKGKITNWGLVQFLNTIPKSTNGNPNNGFVGSPFSENSYTYSAIYPAPLTTWGKKYGNVTNISGSSLNTLLNEVKNGNPVVTWVTINFQPLQWGNWNFGVAANNNHAVTLDGYNKSSNQVHVSDPISGSYWLSRTTFETIYNARKYAVVVR